MKIVQKLFIFVSVIVLCAGCTPKQTEETNQTQHKLHKIQLLGIIIQKLIIMIIIDEDSNHRVFLEFSAFKV